MNWLMEHMQIVIGVGAAIAYFLNRRKREQEEAAEAQRQPPRAHSAHSAEQEERTRRVQDEIRRKIAERRRGAHSGAGEQTLERSPPPLNPPQFPPLDPFGGPARRILRKLEEAAANMEQPFEDPAVAAQAAEAARRAKLAEQLRELEAVRAEQERRAAAIAAARKKQRAQPTVAVIRQGNLRTALRDPRELRRAVVLREVLGPPVALRPPG